MGLAFPGSIACHHGLYYRWEWHTKRGSLKLCNRRRKIDPIPLTCCAKDAEGSRDGQGALPGCFATCIIVYKEYICAQFLD